MPVLWGMFQHSICWEVEKKCSMHFRLLLVLRLWTNAARGLFEGFLHPINISGVFPSFSGRLPPPVSFPFLVSFPSKKYGMCSKTRPNWTGISRLYNSKKLLLPSIFELDISEETKKPSLFSQSNKSLCFVQKLAKTIPLLLTQFVVHFSWPFFHWLLCTLLAW